MARLGIYLAILLLLIPGIGRADEKCSISPLLKKLLIDQANALPDEAYGNHMHSNPNGMESRFNDSTRISELADEEGNLILFRGIQTDYIKGFKGPFAKIEANSNSYSLSPEMAATWPYGNVVVISVQNISRDKLLFPKADAKAEALRTWEPIRNNTRVGEIAHYDEVKVPVDNERVIAQVDRDQILEALKSHQGKPYRLRDLINKLAANEVMKYPNCDEALIPPKSSRGEGKIITEARLSKIPFFRWLSPSSGSEGASSMDHENAR